MTQASPEAQQKIAERALALPSFKRPPVVEVAISVQFDPLTEFQPIHFGLFSTLLGDRYTRSEHHPPLGSVVELWAANGPQRATLRVEQGFPVGRCWYLTEDRLRLLQLQPDRFILNWRKLDSDVEYPSYETLRRNFERELKLLLRFMDENKLGSFTPTQCELTYVNHLRRGIEWDKPRDFATMLTAWSGTSGSSFLPEVENLRLNWQYRFEENNEPLGRLHVQLQAAARKSDHSPLYVLQLVARGAPAVGTMDGVLDFTDKAHEWIVRGFTEITTERMHSIWERQR